MFHFIDFSFINVEIISHDFTIKLFECPLNSVEQVLPELKRMILWAVKDPGILLKAGFMMLLYVKS